MSKLVIYPSKISGQISAPASKSHSLRAILLASFATGKSVIKNALISKDTKAAIKACRDLGAHIEKQGKNLLITGMAHSPKPLLKAIDCGNSGIILRFLAALLAVSDQEYILTGDASIQTNRIVSPLIEGLNQLGASAESVLNNNKAPIKVCGKVTKERANIEGIDSQPVSALIFLAAFLNQKTQIRVSNPGEKPWIDLTLSWLDLLKVPYNRKGYELFTIEGQGGIKGFEFNIPGDFSSSAFPLAAALLTKGQLCMTHLNFMDSQGDKAFFSLLQRFGAPLEQKSSKMYLSSASGAQLCGEIDVNAFIDSLPILAVIASQTAKGSVSLINAEVSQYKECNRPLAISRELRKMGAQIKEDKGRLYISKAPLKGAFLNSHHDHRIAMALCAAALCAQGKSEISDVDCILKSYPKFVEDLKSLGANIEVV